MSLNMLLEVLGTLKRLATELASMRLQRHMDSNVRCDMIAFDNLNMAVGPRALQVEIVSALATNMFITDMILGRYQLRLLV